MKRQLMDQGLDSLIELGEIEHKHRVGAPLTETERAIRDAALEMSCGEGSTRGIILARAAQVYVQHCEQQIRAHGGTVVRETHRIRNGRGTIERRVEHFPPPKSVQVADPAPRSRPRARGAGRPKAQTTRSSARSGDSGEDGLEDSSEPPKRRRLCAFCGDVIPADRSPRATHCSDKHADRDRQRRKRERDRARARLPCTPTTADYRRMLELGSEELAELLVLSLCRCNGRHQEFEPGECFRCGHSLPRGVVA